MPQPKHVHLRKFTPEQLLLDAEETRSVLKFFFEKSSVNIDGLAIDDRIRGYAQGLILEAIDTSYAYGFVHVISDTFYMKPPTNVAKAIRKFAIKASLHWFKNATATDLTNAKIYDWVRIVIWWSFRKDFEIFVNDTTASTKHRIVVVNYSVQKQSKIVWEI